MKSEQFILAVVQARLSSRRFPAKVLYPINDMSLLQMILSRVSKSLLIDDIVVATTIDSSDDPLVSWLQSHNYNFYRGSISNVLQRFYLASLPFKPSIIVRITADDPFKDPSIIDSALHTLLSNPELDYVSNTLDPTFPEGLDIEVFRFNALECAYQKATLLSDLEHVTPYIWSRDHVFNLFNFKYHHDLSSYRLTVDYKSDLLRVFNILNHYNNNIYVSATDIMRDILSGSLTLDHSSVVRNEGYLQSLKDDIS